LNNQSNNGQRTTDIDKLHKHLYFMRSCIEYVGFLHKALC
jgi:hypothetical protein